MRRNSDGIKRMIDITIKQERGKIRILYAGTFTQAKTWARETFKGAEMWFSPSKWAQAGDPQFAYYQRKAGHEYQVPCLSGPIAGMFMGTEA